MPRFLFLALALAFVAPAQQVHREGTEWCDVWMPNMNAAAHPRVMLLGDSITRGYFAAVERALKDQAYVARIATSKALGDPALLDEITTFLKQSRFDVVHFNIGMHGWAYTEDEYRRAFPDLVAAIRRAAPNAKLVWASTTPVRKDKDGGASNPRIEARNTIAREYAAAHDIPVDDLYALMVPHSDLHADDIHFNPQGSDLLAAQVAREIQKLLPHPALAKSGM